MTNWLTLKDAARYLKLGKSTIYKLARDRRIPAHKTGRHWRFDSDELDDWVRRQHTSPPEQR